MKSFVLTGLFLLSVLLLLSGCLQQPDTGTIVPSNQNQVQQTPGEQVKADKTPTELSPDRALLQRALDEKNIGLCEGISEQNLKYSCFTGVAVLLNDSSLCDKIPVESKKNYCVKKSG